MRPPIAVVAFCAVLVFESGGLGQSIAQTPSSFRAGIDLVQVDVAVLDKSRHPVAGLNASDFTLFEDGKPRPIAAFTEVTLPARPAPTTTLAAWTREVPADAATNALPDDGRVVVIVIDRSIPDGYPTMAARDIAKAAVDQLGPGDLGAVVYTGPGVPQDLTPDHARLVAAIDRSNPAGENSASVNEYWNTMVTELFADLNRFVATDADPSATHELPTAWGVVNYSTDCLCGACVLQSIGRIADALREVPRRRKSLLFIGTDVNIETTDTPCIDPVRKARDAMFRSLDLADVTIHALDPLGLETVSLQASSSGRSRDASGALGFRGGRSTTTVDAGPRQNNLVRQGNISVLPDRTGGRTVLNVNNPTARVAEIFHESDSYYLLGFAPAVFDGKRHDIRVRVDKRGLDVRTRRAYVATDEVTTSAPKATTTVSAREAVTSTMPTRDGVTLHASASAFEARGTRQPFVAVAVHVQHAPDAAPMQAGSSAEDVEVVTAVFTMAGQPVGALRQTLSVTPRRGVSGATYDLLQRIPARPGRYELRIGVRNTKRRQTGSVQLFVDVPAFASLSFALSDIGLFAPDAPLATNEDLSNVLPAPTTARRDFDRTERVVAFVRIYQDDGFPRQVGLSARVVDAHDREVFAQKGAIDPAAFALGKSADYVLPLPIAELDTGAYLLEIVANATGTPIRRYARFQVK